MKILVTGGNGYIGKSIYFALRDKHDVTAITRQDFDLTCWTSTHNFFHDKSFDIVIHAAVVGGHRLQEDNDSVLRENLLMYRNLLNHQDKFTKFISFGSGAELHNPTTPYGISKQAIADSMFSKPNFLNLRIFAVFGENELDTRFIKSNIAKYINKEDMLVHEDKQMDFFYIEDLVSLVDYFVSREEWVYQELDCIYMEKFSLMDVAEMINNLSDYKVDIKVGINRGSSYIGTWRGLPIRLVGLKQGIKETYNKLKDE